MPVLIQTVLLFLSIYSWLILARVLLSWLRPGGGYGGYRRGGGDWMSQLESFLYRVTDPLLEPLRRLLPTGGMGIDFSPMIALLLLQLLRGFLAELLRRL